ncbi:MAG TPA: molybdopterin cofactor-binding domain-containing protein [Anaerovoracaceae bacterium]|nr:molybdopterin cofactor-binding domain-containing protein [Anaerovoracaceae bacterium]
MATQKKVLILNGVERMFLCDPDADSLADVIRRLGLTGTKIGCNTGQCGACSVILDGKLVRSCTKKIKNVNDYSSVFTIEGMGTADNLHPLQLAWMVHGGVQCGFCTPGFIVSAKALLDENPNPAREEVREWFKTHRNACRCTGYKQLVDAVMDAAKVLRGEKTMEDLAWKLPEDEKIYGTKIPRPFALSKVLGTCDYGDDLAIKTPDLLHLAVVMPGVSHANIKGIDYSEAEKAPGVFKIVTSKDVKGLNRITFPLGHPRALADGFEHPLLLDTKVFRLGDVVALVAADTPRHAREAAKLVKLELEPLPEYMDSLDSMADDAIQVHPGAPNIFLEVPVFKGEDTRKAIEESEYVVEGSFSTTRQPHLTIEPDVAQAYLDPDGILTIHIKSHGIYLTQALIAAGLGLPPEKIRIIQNPSGGSFGYAISPFMAGVVGSAALATGRAVSLTLSYEEHMHITGKRAASYSNGRLACDKNGKLKAIEFELAYDKGSYSELATPLIEAGIHFYGWPYTIPNVMGLGKAVFSNQSYSTAYRGFGAPQAMNSSENLMDMLAEKVGMDPLEFRYINVFRQGDISNCGVSPKVFPMAGILERLRPRYQSLIERARKESTPLKKRGVGVAVGSYLIGTPGDHAEIYLELNPDGTVTNFNTWEDIGQGGDVGTLVHTHEALRPLGLRPDQIKLVMNDTALCPNTGLAAGSRSHFMCGRATLDGAEKLLDAMRKPDGTYRTYDEMKAEGIPTKYTGVYDQGSETYGVDPNAGQGNPCIEYSYSAYATEVEVDVATGKVTVLAMHCVADVGPVGNYLALDGQVYGGMEHMIGFALSEDYSDPKKHKTLIGAGFPYIDMIPDGDNYTVEYIETKRPDGPHGSCGASEAFQTGGHVSVISAIYNAVGVRINTLPATPEKVKAALEARKKSLTSQTEKYYLGGDFYEKMDYIKANPV